MHIMCMYGSMADAVTSGSCPILFKVITLKVTICIVRLYFSNFCLSSVADFSNTEARAPTSAGHTPFLPARRAMRFWTGGLGVGHGYLLMAVSILINRSYPYR